MNWEKIQLSNIGWQDIISDEVKISPILAKILAAQGLLNQRMLKGFCILTYKICTHHL